AVESITSVFAGASGSAPVPKPLKSVHCEPPLVVLNTCAPPKPMMATYAVCPVASELSTATLEMVYWLGLIFCVTSAHVLGGPAAFNVRNTRPPAGAVACSGPEPSVVAYTTLDSPLASLGPPAAIARTKFVSVPVQPAVALPVSKLKLSCV